MSSSASFFLSCWHLTVSGHRSICEVGPDTMPEGVGTWDLASWAVPKMMHREVCVCGYVLVESILANGKQEKRWVRQMNISFSLLGTTLRRSLSSWPICVQYWVSKPYEWYAEALSSLWSGDPQGNTLLHKASCFPFPHFPFSFIVRALGLPFHISCKQLNSASGSSF